MAARLSWEAEGSGRRGCGGRGDDVGRAVEAVEEGKGRAG